jgi:hypothetical protein
MHISCSYDENRYWAANNNDIFIHVILHYKHSMKQCWCEINTKRVQVLSHRHIRILSMLKSCSKNAVFPNVDFSWFLMHAFEPCVDLFRTSLNKICR